MKKLSATLLSLTALVVMFLTGCRKDPVPTPTDPTPTISITITNITQTSVDVTISATNYTNLSVSGAGFSKTATGTYTITGLTANTSYTLSGVVSNATKSTSMTQTFTTSPASIYTAVFTAVDASTTATLKSLPGNSATEGLVVNVTSGGFVKLDVNGVLTNGNPAIGYWWITDRDSSELFQATSTLNPKFVKIVAAATQNINLAAGKYVICFKTAPYSGAITNGAAVGIKLTGANNNTVSTSAYTADATSANATNVVKIYLKQVGGVKASANLQTTGFAGGDMQIIPYSDEAGNTYDGNLYPSINFLSFDTKNTSWISPVAAYSSLDFTNASGGAKQNFVLAQDNNGPISNIFLNTDAAFTSGVLQFSKSTGVKLLKSNLGNFSYCSTATNVYNPTATQFGPANVCWYLKSVRFVGNPELWIYDPSGNRIW